MDKLELRHIAPYLPYELEFKDPETVTPGVMVAIVAGMPGLLFYENKDEIYYFDLGRIKPLLLPLSELRSEKYINIFFEKDGFMDEVTETNNQLQDCNNFINQFKITDNDYCHPYNFFSLLFQHHFDVFGLINAGLALNKLDHI